MLEHIWIPKALVQAAICRTGMLPLYHWGQQRVGRLRNFHPRSRIEYAAKLAVDVAPVMELRGAFVVEVGTGWVPVVPLVLHLMGVERVVTYDLNRHLQPDLTMRTVQLMGECFDELQYRVPGLDVGAMTTRLDRLRTATGIEELLRLAGIEYRAPADVSYSRLAGTSVDLLYSNLVLEHVQVDALRAIHLEAARIVKPGGICWHNVDFTDHFSATMPLSPINFLRYSPSFWERFGNNDILYQNRMRRSDHVQLLNECGCWKVLTSIDYRSSAARALADEVLLDPAYRSYQVDDLTTTASRLVLRAGKEGGSQ